MQKRQVPIPEWSKNSVIYEVNLRQYTPHGTFDEFTKEIPRLKQLGVDILWFMPIYPIGAKNRKGSLGSYYSVRDYMSVNPEHGTFDDFKKMVKLAHDAGMKVILDWVANHSSWDNKLIFEHPEWYSKDSKDNIIVPEGTEWSDVADLDFSEHELWDYMVSAMRYWLNQANVDGFRCDVAGMVPTEFWNYVYPALKSEKSDLFMLAEWDDPVLHEEAFHMSYAWEIHKIFTGIFKGDKNVSDLENELLVEKSRYLPEAYRMHFTSNHDENSWNGSEYERLGSSHECFAALTYVLPGMPLIYSGQEAGNKKRLSFFERDTIEWKGDPMVKVYQQLNDLKHSNPAIWNGSWGGDSQRIGVSDPQILILKRSTEGNTVVGIFNLQHNRTQFKLPSDSISGKYFDLNGKIVMIDPDELIHLDSWQYTILSTLPS